MDLVPEEQSMNKLNHLKNNCQGLVNYNNKQLKSHLFEVAIKGSYLGEIWQFNEYQIHHTIHNGC